MLRAMKYQDYVPEFSGLWKQKAVAQEHHRFTSSPSQTDPPVASFLIPPFYHRKEASHEERHSNDHFSNNPQIPPLAANSLIPRM